MLHVDFTGGSSVRLTENIEVTLSPDRLTRNDNVPTTQIYTMGLEKSYNDTVSTML